MGAPVNVSTLARLADKDIEKSATDFGALPLDIRESVTRQMNKARQDIIDAAAGQIVALLAAKDEFVVSGVQRINQLKEQIAAQEKILSEVARATAYGTSNQNFLPLASMLGLGTGGAKADLCKIPAGWAPPTAEAPAPAQQG